MHVRSHLPLKLIRRRPPQTKTPETSRLLASSSLTNSQSNRISHLRLSRPATSDLRRALRFRRCRRSTSNLSSIDSSGAVADPFSGLRRSSVLRPCLQFRFRLTACSSAKETLGAAHLCRQVQIEAVMCIRCAAATSAPLNENARNLAVSGVFIIDELAVRSDIASSTQPSSNLQLASDVASLALPST